MLPRERRRALVLALAPSFGLRGAAAALTKLVEAPVEGNAWHADHVVAVRDGGGEGGLSNLRTLCTPCAPPLALP